jgi:hypothetical protein
MTRPILVYLVIVTVDVWVGYAVQDLQQGGDLVRAPLVATAAVLGSGLEPLVFLSLLLIPAMVLTIELVHRLEATSRAARSVLGAATWAGWCLFIAITAAVASRLVLVSEMLGAVLVLLAGSGAAFSLLAFDGSARRQGNALSLLALVVAAFVVAGSIWMAGRWGGPA